MVELPTGTVTFLFTDVEGSTRLLQELGGRYHEVQRDHFRLMREAVAEGDGVEIRTEGDAFFVVFPTPAGAVRAAAAAQRALAAHRWSHGGPLRVRMGLHTGEATLGGDDYLGIDVNRAARIAAAGYGGQVVLSSTTGPLVERSLPEGVTLRDLGTHQLKDFDQPERLYQLVIEGLPDEFPALRTLDARPTNLPEPRNSFIGRDEEVEALREAVLHHRLVTLTGPGGTGKTRLAIEASSGLLDEFADGVFFVDLSPIRDPALVASAIAEVLKVGESPGAALADVVASHVRDREMLLVLDNMEQVVEAALTVQRLLEAGPRLTVLVTSRVPLHLTGEREIGVPPLELPDVGTVSGPDALIRYEAVALFIDRATAIRPSFRVTEANAPAIAELVGRLDGLPLAVELAAGRIRLMNPETMLARLGQRLPLLSGGARDLPERQRTLRATIEWSHELLDDDERRLFARVAVFAGGWTLEAAEAVCGGDVDVLDGLGSLVDKSLVRRVDLDGAEPRFAMLETIREYAGELLAASGEADRLRRRHAELFRDLAEEAEPNLTGDEAQAWLGRLDGEHDNLRAALGRSLEAGDAEAGLRLAASMWRFWQRRGLLTEGRTWLERLLDLPAAGVRTATRARALEALAGLAYWQNDYEVTRPAYAEAEAIAREIGDKGLLARVLWSQSYVAEIDGDRGRAEALLREALTAAEAAGDRVMAALVMVEFGFLLGRTDPIAALEPLRRGVGILEELGMRGLLPDYVGGLGLMEARAGNLEEARRRIRRASELTLESGSELGIGQMLRGIAMIELLSGRHERAARLLGAESRIRTAVGGGAPPEIWTGLWGDLEAEARSALGDQTYEQAHTEGAAMTHDQAMAYALED